METLLRQFLEVTHDGNVISKIKRDELVKLGYVDRTNGWNFITKAGVEYLVKKGYLKP